MSSQTTAPSDPESGDGGVGGSTAVLIEMSQELRELSSTMWAARRGDELTDDVIWIETIRSQLDAIELDVVREIEGRGEAKQRGWASTQDFVTAVAGGHRGSGPAVVRLATTTAEPVFAPIAEAMRDGWLSTTKAQVIQRAVDALPHGAELRSRGVQVLLEQAKRLDATELRKAARYLAAKVDPDGEERRDEKALDREERAAHLGRLFSIRDDGAGGAWIKGRCSSEDAALIRSSLLPLAKPQPNSGPDCDAATCDIPGCSHDGRDPRDHGARMLDALVEACRRLQASDLLPTSHGARPRVNVRIDLDDLKAAMGHGITDTGEDLSAETVRKMACDADVIPVVLGADSAVLDVGRLQRLVTAAIWYALVTRDKHCRFPGCSRPPIMCHAHHLVHWVDGGVTSLDNLVLLCGHHHRLVHAGPWTITRGSAGGLDFAPPPGVRRLADGPRPPPRE